MFCLIALFASPAFGQVTCKDGKCQLANGVVIAPLQEEVFIDSSTLQAATTESDADRLNRIIRATVRVTVSGVCGSGTVVGRDGAGNAIVLTNAHVAGTQKGRIVQLERWEQDGTSEKGQGAVIASGYGRGMSVDFALLKCNTDFAKDVVPIPWQIAFQRQTVESQPLVARAVNGLRCKSLSSIGQRVRSLPGNRRLSVGDRARASSITPKQVHVLLDF